MSQTRIMSIHRLLMRLFSAFCGEKALNGNAKHFVFDLTCDVTSDPGVKVFNFIRNISSTSLHCRLNFSAASIGYRDRWGGGGATSFHAPIATSRDEQHARFLRRSSSTQWRIGRGIVSPYPPARTHIE